MVRVELKPVPFEPLSRAGRCNRHVPGMTIARDTDTPTLLARWARFVGGRRYGGGQSACRTRQRGATDEAPGRAGTTDPVRELSDEGFRRARVESWTRDDLTIVREATGRELCPATRPGTPIPVKTARIVDRAVWVDGEGVAQGVRTECVGWLADGAGDQAQSAEARLAPYGGSLQSR